jgi:predicted DNA-binding ribbon-helix-helix protein
MSTDTVRRTLEFDGRLVALELEAELWDDLVRIARREMKTPGELVASIDRRRGAGDTLKLGSAVRIFIAGYRRAEPGLFS